MSRLSLYLLGPPRIERDGVPIKVDTRKATALLTYIAITGGRHRRDSLVNLLWPGYDQTHGRAALRRTLSTLRKALVGDWLDVDRESVGLNPYADPSASSGQAPSATDSTSASGQAIWLDVDQFHRHLAQCLTHGHPTPEVCPACLIPLTDAVELYRGDFLSGFSLKDSFNFDDWQFFQADGLRRELAGALERLVRCHSAQGEFESAASYARRWLALDRLDESAHFQLMRLYAWSGQRSAALRQYQECVRILESTLGVSPQETTTRLYKTIQEGRASAPPVGRYFQHPEKSREDETTWPTDRLLDLPIQPPSFLDEEAGKGEPIERSVFVARERELAQLDEFLDLALAGQGQVIFVTGNAGRGKTALVQEFTRRAQAAHLDLIVASGNCNAHTGIGDPYLPFREIVGLLTGDVEARWAAGAMTREQARRLWHLLPLAVQALVEVGPDLIDTFTAGIALVNRAVAAQITTPGIADWMPRLKELIKHRAAVSGDSNPQQNALFEQYTRVLQALARRRPLLLALDDLQWADAGSTSLLFHLGRRIEGHRILIVGAYRPTEVTLGRGEERHPLESVVNEFKRRFGDIEVDLGKSEGWQFVDALLDTEPNRLGDAFRETLYRQTRGHPLFTVELLRGMEERGDLVQDEEGRWVEGPSLNWETLPTRVEAVIAERIGRLPERLRKALTVASIEGETFTAEVVAQVRAADEGEVVAHLSGELDRQHRLVSSQGLLWMGSQRLSQYRFRHILFQKYLYNSLDSVERAHLHRAVGTALEALYGEGAEEIAVIAVQLARHFQEAGITEKAVAYLLLAGNRAMRLSANEEAIAHFTQGLRLLKTLPDSPECIQQELDLLVALGVPLVLTQGHAAPEVETTYARARELSRRVGDTSQRFHALMGLRRFYLHRGELQTAHEMGEQLIALAQSVPDHLSRAHMMHGETLYCLGEFAQAQEHYRQGITLYAPRQQRSHIFLYGNDTEVICRVFWALPLWHFGYPDQALEMSTEGLFRAQELSHPFTLVCALYFTATVHQLRREVQAVQERVEALLQTSTERGFTLYLAWGAILQGWALVEQGQEDAGIEQIRKGIAAQQTATMLPNALACLARAYGKVGKVEEGLSTLIEALSLVDRSGERCWEAELYRLKGELLQQDRAEAEAEACFRRAIEVARCQSARSWELRATVSLCRLWQKQGRREVARELLQEIYDWFTEGFDTADLKEAQALLDALT